MKLGLALDFSSSKLGILSSAAVGVIQSATIGNQSAGTISLDYLVTGNINVIVMFVSAGTFVTTDGLASQIAAQSVPGGVFLSGTLTATGTSLPLGSLPEGMDDRFDVFVMPDGGGDDDIVYAQSAVIDSLNPTLSSPTAEVTGETELTLTVTTNEASGAIYARSRAPMDPVSSKDTLLASTFRNATPVMGVNGVLITGLAENVEQVIDVIQVDSQDNWSAILTSNPVTPSVPTVFTDIFDYSNGTALRDTPNWTAYVTGAGAGMIVEDGQVYLEQSSGAGETILRNDMPLAEDVDVEFDVTALGASPFSMEYVIKASDTSMTDRLVVYMDGAGGTARLWGYTGSTLNFNRWLPTPIELQTYRVKVVGTQIELFVNGSSTPSITQTWSNTFQSVGSGFKTISNNKVPVKTGRFRAEVLS